MKRFADGYILVIGHHHQKEPFFGGTGTKTIVVDHAVKERHHLTHVDKHLGSHKRWRASICKGQAAQEWVHGGVKMGVLPDEKNQSKVACHGGEVDDQEHQEQGELQPWETCSCCQRGCRSKQRESSSNFSVPPAHQAFWSLITFAFAVPLAWDPFPTDFQQVDSFRTFRSQFKSTSLQRVSLKLIDREFNTHQESKFF